MTKFKIELAEIVIEANVFYKETMEYCRDYLTDKAPEISVEITRQRIEKLREMNRQSNHNQPHEGVEYSDEYFELLALADAILEKILPYDIIMFHGAVMAVDGKAYIFTAPSGTGKSTHCKLWIKNFPDAHILNGDKPLILFKDGNAFAIGGPWKGKEQFGVNESLPIEAICILERDTVNHIEPISHADCMNTLIRQSNTPEGNGNFVKVVRLLSRLTNVKFYRLGCNMDDEAATVSRNGMVKP